MGTWGTGEDGWASSGFLSFEIHIPAAKSIAYTTRYFNSGHRQVFVFWTTNGTRRASQNIYDSHMNCVTTSLFASSRLPQSAAYAEYPEHLEADTPLR
jgi:hypothetical protein